MRVDAAKERGAVGPDPFCVGCCKQVLDVRQLTLTEATRLFAREEAAGRDVCVKGYADEAGFLAFVDESTPRVARPLARWALAASMTACSATERSGPTVRQPAVAETVRHAPTLVAAASSNEPPISAQAGRASRLHDAGTLGAIEPASAASSSDAGAASGAAGPCDHTDEEHAAMAAREERRARSQRRRTTNGRVDPRHVGPIMGGVRLL